MKGDGFLEVAGGEWGRQPGAPPQQRQPLADLPSPDSINPKISVFFQHDSQAELRTSCDKPQTFLNKSKDLDHVPLSKLPDA